MRLLKRQLKPAKASIMLVTLYTPGQPPRTIEPEGFALPNPDTGLAQVTSDIAQELGCAPGLVDVMDCGPDFAAYTIFDCEGEVNEGGAAHLCNGQSTLKPTLALIPTTNFAGRYCL